MAADQALDFLQQITENVEIWRKVKDEVSDTLTRQSLQRLANVAAEYGYEISVEDLQRAFVDLLSKSGAEGNWGQEPNLADV